jgi:phage terminase large subunit-like protein
MPITAAQLARLPHDQRRAALETLSTADLASLEWCWEFWARPDQLPPPGNWRTWLLLGGRGSGKTKSASEWVRAEMESGRRRQIGIVAPTADSARRIMVEGPSGIMSVTPPWCRPSYEPSTRRIVWPNGGIVHIFSAEEPDRLRGPNLDGFWGDELTSWNDASEVWNMLMMALRIPGPQGHPPAGVVSTTPKPLPLLKQIMQSSTTVITRAKTSDNVANLDASTLQYLNERYAGTRLGRQELDTELLEDHEGALWNRSLIDATRIRRADAPDLRRVVVAIDPPGASSKDSAECGLVIAGIGPERPPHAYVLADMSARLSPERWARRAVEAYHGWKADRIVAEQNFGGAMVESTIKSIDPLVPVKMVVASRGKMIRAEPISALYEQNRVHHVGEFQQLEDQMCSWAPNESGPSPDRIDALVWCITELMGGRPPMRIDPDLLRKICDTTLYPETHVLTKHRYHGY